MVLAVLSLTLSIFAAFRSLQSTLSHGIVLAIGISTISSPSTSSKSSKLQAFPCLSFELLDDGAEDSESILI